MNNIILKNIKLPLLFLCLLFCANTIFAQNALPSRDDCLACHDDKTISKIKNGKPFSLEVKKTDLENSAHAKLLCVNCHKDFNPEDMPHKAIITPVNCSSCHSDVIKKHSFHPQMANVGANKELSNCKNCHGTHKITKVK